MNLTRYRLKLDMCSDWSLSSLRVSFEIDVNTCFFPLNIFCYSRRPRKMNTQFKPSVLVYLSSKFSFFPTYLIDVLNYHKPSSGNCLFSLTFYFQETKIDHSFFIMIIIRLFLISLYIYPAILILSLLPVFWLK